MSDTAPRPERDSGSRLRQLWDQGRRREAIHGALDEWAQLLRHGDDVGWLEPALRSCGLPAEALALQAALTRRRGGNFQPLIRSVLQSGDPWWAAQLLDELQDDSRDVHALRIEVTLAVGDDPSELIDAWVRRFHDEGALQVAIEWLMRCHRIDEVDRLLERFDGLPLWRARFALWRRQPSRAREFLRQAPDSDEARCIEAVADIQDGNLDHAESLLTTLTGSEQIAGEAWSWLATVYRKQERYTEAVTAADKANSATAVFNLALRMERELSADLGNCEGGRKRMRTVQQLRHAWAVYPLGVRPEDSVACLEALLDRIAGNHTAYLTTVDAGQLTTHVLPIDPGQLGRNAQHVLWTRGPQAVRALCRELAARVDGDPSFHTYEGEFELWMGEYEQAARIFRAALDRDTSVKWAWIGLGASAMLQGDLGEAQAIWAKGLSIIGGTWPMLFVYRGECHRRQGEVALARQDLELAVRQHPQRLSAWINLALLEGDGEQLREVERRCMTVAPLLMEELSGSPTDKLEKVLDAMRGNRSSSLISYLLWDRVWGLAS